MAKRKVPKIKAARRNHVNAKTFMRRREEVAYGLAYGIAHNKGRAAPYPVQSFLVQAARTAFYLKYWPELHYWSRETLVKRLAAFVDFKLYVEGLKHVAAWHAGADLPSVASALRGTTVP